MRRAPTELETARLRLRRWRDDDLDALHALNGDERVYRYLSGFAYSRDETAAQLARFRDHWERHGFGIFAVEERETGSFVGRCGPAFHRLWPDHPELGWMLAPAVWGRGYATEAGAACLPPLFEELGFDRAVSIVRPDNSRSIAVQDRLGFHDWRHVLWEETGITLLVRSLTRLDWRRRVPAETWEGARSDERLPSRPRPE